VLNKVSTGLGGLLGPEFYRDITIGGVEVHLSTEAEELIGSVDENQDRSGRKARVENEDCCKARRTECTMRLLGVWLEQVDVTHLERGQKWGRRLDRG
jgi:hypothetical protein